MFLSVGMVTALGGAEGFNDCARRLTHNTDVLVRVRRAGKQPTRICCLELLIHVCLSLLHPFSDDRQKLCFVAHVFVATCTVNICIYTTEYNIFGLV